ncbi:MAG: LysM peptidoglycan-binding domain-containing protein [Acidobacteria bacterium]|nr:LysM peptidoglycan-binding domain-containing protein [Acidobacteriota bacterium]
MERAIAAAEGAFEAGRAASQQGHLSDARLAFDLALDTLLVMPGGGRSDPRLSVAVDSLTDRISALELATLSSGDGFTETGSEPASIDTLLSLPSAEADAMPAPDVATAVEADLAVTAHDIPIPLNDRVLRFVELFQGRLRGFLTEGLTRGAPYLPMIHMVFREEGLPLDLGFVPLVESAFKPTAVSRASARGVWQFMRGTGTENGLKHDWYIDERADPEKSTRAAAKYLKTLYKMFGDWHLALASYNGGPGRVQRAMTRSGIDDFWSLTASSKHLPRETRDYVPMILAAAIIARNPAQYGFDVPAALPFAPDVLTVTGPVDLRRVAEWAGVSADDVRALNPELRRWTTPVRAREYELRVPIGTMRAVLDGYSGALPEHSALQWHTVRKGESLATIARRLGVSRVDLAEANYLTRSARVQPGQRLVVPRAPSAALLAGRLSGGAASSRLAAAETTTREPEATRTVYRVRKGDTLFSIARRHGVSIENLRAWNRLKGSALSIGDRLQIHSSRSADTQ